MFSGEMSNDFEHGDRLTVIFDDSTNKQRAAEFKLTVSKGEKLEEIEQDG